jgi:hypothetical protein
MVMYTVIPALRRLRQKAGGWRGPGYKQTTTIKMLNTVNQQGSMIQHNPELQLQTYEDGYNKKINQKQVLVRMGEIRALMS